jgi:AcrR family transcriptional regulator
MSSPEDPRRRLLEAAGQIFAEKGFEGATVREIKDRAGVNIAAVNYYFQSKERLYIEAVKNASCGSLDHSPLPACAEWVRDYVRPNAEVLTGILEELLPPGTPSFKRYLTGFSIMGQCLHYMQNKPVIQLLMGDEYAQITPEAVAAHVTEFSLAALGLKAPRPKTAHSARGKS